MISPRQVWTDKQSLKGIRLDGIVAARIYLGNDISSTRSPTRAPRVHLGGLDG